MGLISFCSSLLLFSSIIFQSCLFYKVVGDNAVIRTEREALEIIIGGGGYSPSPSPEYEECPPPPPPEPICPPPPPPPSPPPPSPRPPPRPSPPRPSARPPPRRPSYYPFPSENIKRDYFTIQKFKTKIKHDPMKITKTWNGFGVCKTYKGFYCATVPDQKVTALAAADFNGYSFGGPEFQLSGFIEKLLDISIFHANSNNFTVSVPKLDARTNSRYVFELDLSNNKLTGGFPMEVLGATNLTFLDIRFNSLSGPIPSQVFNLDLDVLFLNNNKFSQYLPDNLGSTPALYLTFANNKFTGPIPRSIGKASNLLEVLFLNNQLSGCLPYEIGFLKQSTVFDVSCNNLTGPIPHSFACLANIQILNLARNEFYGAVPEMVCTLPKLQNLSLSHNYFTQVGPECRKKIREKVLDVRMNCILDLPDQKTAAECAEFFSKRQTCRNQRSLTYIPCKTNGYSSSTETSDQQSTVAAAPPRSYDALIPHKL